MDSTSTPVPAGDDTVDLTAEAVVAGDEAVEQASEAMEPAAAETVRLTSEDVAQAVAAAQDVEPVAEAAEQVATPVEPVVADETAEPVAEAAEQATTPVEPVVADETAEPVAEPAEQVATPVEPVVADETAAPEAEPAAEDAGESCPEGGESVMAGDVTVNLAAETAAACDDAAEEAPEAVESADGDDTVEPAAETVAEAAETAEAIEPAVTEEAAETTEATEQAPVVVEPVTAETVRLTSEAVAQAVAACQDVEPADGDDTVECADGDETVEPEPEAVAAGEDVAPEAVEPVVAHETVRLTSEDVAQAVAACQDSEPVAEAEPAEPAEPASESVAEPTVADEPLPASIAPAAAAPEPLPASIEPAVAAPGVLPASIAPTVAAPEPLPASIEPAVAVAPVDAPADHATLPAVAADVPSSAAPVVAVEPASRGRRRLGTLLGVGAGLLLLLWGGTAAATTQHIFSGSTVSGVDVGGMSTEQAQQAVTDALSAQLDEAVTVSVPGGDHAVTDTLVPAQSGVSLDAAASVDALTSFTLNPVTIIDRLTGTEVQAVTAVDTEALTAALNSRLSTLSQGTIDATVTLDGTTPVLTPAVAGTGVDVAASVDRLRSGWPLGQQTVELVSGTTEPAVTDAEAQALIDDVLTPLLASDITVTAAGTEVAAKAQADAVLTPADIASTVSIVNEAGTLSAHLDPTLLHDAVVEDMGSAVETAPADATFTIEGSAAGTPVFVPGNSGVGIDSEALATAVLEARDGQRRVTLPVTVTEPDHNEPEAQWGITQVVGEYATPFYYDPVRTQNLTAGTAAINGTVVMPGETFSLTEALGPVDAEHGFAAAGVYTNGVHSNAMGGGLSQVATTVFNAGFEAGMDDVEHHPHSVWFTRYPAGREATLWTGVLDVKWTNSTPYAVLVNAWVSDGEVHVRLWSTHYYDVSISSSEHTAYRPVRTETSNAPGCEPYEGGQAGFDVTVTRSRTAPDGTRPADDVLTTSYAADNALVCTS